MTFLHTNPHRIPTKNTEYKRQKNRNYFWKQNKSTGEVKGEMEINGVEI